MEIPKPIANVIVTELAENRRYTTSVASNLDFVKPAAWPSSLGGLVWVRTALGWTRAVEIERPLPWQETKESQRDGVGAT
jgi:hypothetical protein